MNTIVRNANGWIEVICGSMFSGKSEELIRRLRRAQIARQRVQIFKPKMDDRYTDNHIVSHSELKIGSTAVSTSAEILRLVDSGERILVGASDRYEARCRRCFEPQPTETPQRAQSSTVSGQPSTVP